MFKLSVTLKERSVGLQTEDHRYWNITRGGLLYIPARRIKTYSVGYYKDA
jgi:hypothetical protein